MLLDRLSSLAACWRVGLGGRLQASGPGSCTSSVSPSKCRDRLLCFMVGASSWRASAPRACERRRAAFPVMLLVSAVVSFLPAAGQSGTHPGIKATFPPALLHLQHPFLCCSSPQLACCLRNFG